MLLLTGGRLSLRGEGAAPACRHPVPVLGRLALEEDFSAAYTLPISEQEILSSCLFILPGAMV